MTASAGSWLDRFSEPSVIRRRGVVDHVACRELATGEPRLVIATKEPELRALFDEIAQLHRELHHPNIPELDHRGAADGTEYVALRSDAIVDLETMIPITLASGGMAPAATVAFLDAVIGAVRAAHATRHPRTGGPICIGAFSGTNVVVSPDRVDVIGWGYPTTETERRTVLRDASVMHVAWEASFGAPATPNGDLDSVGRFFHAILPATAMPPELIRALRGEVSDERIAELVRQIEQLEDSAHAREPSQRSWDLYLASLRRITELLDTKPDGAVLRSELARLCKLWQATSGLTVAADASWFKLAAGPRTELDRRPNLRAILAALVAHRRDARGEALAADRLVAVGWPSEQLATEPGRNRLRVAISTLRSMGLRDILLSRDDGYLLDPDVGVAIE